MATIRMRTRLSGDTCELRAMIDHPMRTEPRDGVDQRIHTLVIEHNDEEVIRSDWGTAIATDPFIKVAIAGVSEGDTVTMRWEDTDGKSDSESTTV